MKTILFLSGIVIKLLHFLSTPFLWIFSSKNNTKKVPNFSEKLLTISATDLAAKIRQKEISSEEICKVYIKRITQVNPIINAIVEERFEGALRDARNVDAFLKSYSGSEEDLAKRQPLLGVPLTVKESCSLAGSSLCVGTVERRGIKAHRDGETVAHLKRSGAIPLAVTNTAELCLGWEGTNPITGRTRNPYDIGRTSGGSSGGEGALLGCGASLLGIGSDIAGSVRLPAMFNGVFGHKPSAGVVSNKGHFPIPPDEKCDDYLVLGPMCRYAQDLKLMLNVMAQENVLLKLKLDQKVDLATINVFYSFGEKENLAAPRVQKEIRNVIEKSVDFLKNKSHLNTKEYRFEELDNAVEIGGALLYNLEGIPNLLKAEKQNLAQELLKCVVGQSKYTFNLLLFYLMQSVFENYVTSEEHFRRNDALKKQFSNVLGDNGVFLYPTFPHPAYPHNSFIFHSFSVSYLMIFNTLGLPSTHVPCGFDSKGLPIGLQVVAGHNQDRLCLAVAEELEKCFGGWKPPQ